jgi:hypothetical protein
MTGAFNRGDPPEAGQPFRRKGLNDFPAALELIDIGDELQDLRRNNDVIDSVHNPNTQFHPMLPNSHPKARQYPISPDFTCLIQTDRPRLKLLTGSFGGL